MATHSVAHHKDRDYSPLGLDPRNEGNQVAHATSELRRDLETLSRDFDGLVLYGYHSATTPRLLALAWRMPYRAVLLSLWQPKDMNEVEGLAALALRYQDRLALAAAYVKADGSELAVETVDDALAGARDIVAEMISEDPTCRAAIPCAGLCGSPC